MKNHERVAMLFQCLLDQTQQKIYFCLIDLLRNNVPKKCIHQYEKLCILTYVIKLLLMLKFSCSLLALLILEPLRHFTYVTAHYPTLPSLYLSHSSFSNPSVASPTSQLILQPFFHFSYVTGSSLTSPGEPPMHLSYL